MQKINVLAIQRISTEDRAKIEAVDPAIELTDAGGWYDGEIRETWPAFTAARYLAPGAAGAGTREQRDRLLAEAEIILGGWPFPLDLRARAPRLKWFHQRPAGASNLLLGDLWGSHVVVTTSRGLGNTLAMAEYARGRHLALRQGPPPRRGRSRCGRVRPSRLSTASARRQDGVRRGRRRNRARCRQTLRRAGHAGRRHPPPGAAGIEPLPPGFSELGGPADLDRFLPESDFVVICCQWTPETTRLFDKGRFAAMKAGSVLVNVARGEIVDEEALADALATRSSARRGARCLCRRIRAHAGVTALVRSQGADHAAYLGCQRSGPPWRHQSLLRQSARLYRWRAAPKCHRLGTGLLKADAARAHDPEKCAAVFPRDKRGTRLRGDHAQTRNIHASAATSMARP